MKNTNNSATPQVSADKTDVLLNKNMSNKASRYPSDIDESKDASSVKKDREGLAIDPKAKSVTAGEKDLAMDVKIDQKTVKLDPSSKITTGKEPVKPGFYTSH